MKLRSLLKSLIMYYLNLTKILPSFAFCCIALHCGEGGTIMEKTTVSRWTRLDMVLGAARNGSAQSCIVFGMEQNTAKNGSSQSCIVIQFVFGFVSCTMLPGIAPHNIVLYCILYGTQYCQESHNRTITRGPDLVLRVTCDIKESVNVIFCNCILSVFYVSNAFVVHLAK